jgi:hypothetical protein
MKKSKIGINASGVTPKSDTRNRIQFRFWLDSKKSDENQLIGDLNHFKSKRKFADTIRRALSLFFALMLGDVSLLKEYFPGVVQAIQNEARTDLEAENARLRERLLGLQGVIDENEDYIQELEADLDKKQPSTPQDNAIQAQLDRLEDLLLSQGYRPETPTQAPENRVNSGVGLKGLSNSLPTFSAPQFDDDDLDDDNFVLDIRKDTSGNSSLNFINAMKGLSS